MLGIILGTGIGMILFSLYLFKIAYEPLNEKIMLKGRSYLFAGLLISEAAGLMILVL